MVIPLTCHVGGARVINTWAQRPINDQTESLRDASNARK